MKRSLTVIALASLSLVAVTANAGLIISEIVDATLPDVLPKFVEVTNTGAAAVDLSAYSIGNINNGGLTMSYEALPLTGMLAAGDSYVISYENSDEPGVGTFYNTYGFDPDFFGTGSFTNGDDVVVLFFGLGPAGDPGTGANVADVYGVPGVDGTGEVWEYTDGYAYRNNDVLVGTNPFAPAEWFFAGPNSLETGDDVEELALILGNTTPGTHDFIPEPATMSLLAVAALGLVRRRR